MPFYVFEGKRPLVGSKAFVHPQAVLIGHVEVGEGCYIGAGAVLRGDIGGIRIGAGSNVQENCVVHTFPDEWTIIHPGAHVGHGAILHGCEIRSNTLIGMGAVISDGVKVNSDCLIGAASFIPAGVEIPPASLVIGSPARVAGRVTDEQLRGMREGREIYQDLARRYLNSFREIDPGEVMAENGPAKGG